MQFSSCVTRCPKIGSLGLVEAKGIIKDAGSSRLFVNQKAAAFFLNMYSFPLSCFWTNRSCCDLYIQCPCSNMHIHFNPLVMFLVPGKISLLNLLLSKRSWINITKLTIEGCTKKKIKSTLYFTTPSNQLTLWRILSRNHYIPINLYIHIHKYIYI